MQRTTRVVDPYFSLVRHVKYVDLLRFLVEKCKADLSYKSYVSLLHVVLEKKDKTVIGEEAMKSKQEECMINFLP